MNDYSNGQTVAGKYRIDEFWCADAVSQTYFATQILIDKPVVFKILNSSLAGDAEAIEYFQIQARTLSRINNQHVLNVLDYGTDEKGLSFLVLENATGRSLREMIETEGSLSLEQATSIATQICSALAAAQASNTVHGNLSSDKILVSQRNDGAFVQVLDFGVMNWASSDEERTVVRGDLPFYKAPEQLTNQSAPDFRSDIYALGIILFEMLSGRRPFTGETPVTIAQKHLDEIPPSLLAARPDLPPVLEQIVQRALAKQPNQRFQSAQDFTEALNRVASSADQQRAAYSDDQFAFVNDQSRPVRAETIDENNRWKTAFIVLAGISLLSLVTIFLTSGKRTDPSTELNSDPNAQAVQPINPVANMGEEFSNINSLTDVNSNINPSVVPPGGVTGVPQGIPPGLYPSGTVTIPGDSNSIFMQDLNTNVNVPANVNANRNANAATNTNARPSANANTTAANSLQQRPNNANTNPTAPVNSNANPVRQTPTPAPTQTPRAARPAPNNSSDNPSSPKVERPNNGNFQP